MSKDSKFYFNENLFLNSAFSNFPPAFKFSYSIVVSLLKFLFKNS